MGIIFQLSQINKKLSTKPKGKIKSKKMKNDIIVFCHNTTITIIGDEEKNLIMTKLICQPLIMFH